jgi:hypothetical protein
VREVGGAPGYPESARDHDDFEGLTAPDKRKIFIEVFSVCSLIAVFVIAGIDLLLERSLTWSAIPIASLAALWLAVCVPLLLRSRPWLVLVILGPALFLYVLCIDLFEGGGLAWFPGMGAPIVALAEALAVGCGAIGAASRRKGLNIVALSLLAIAAFCLGLETIINLNLAHRAFLSWSAVVATAAIPVAGFLYYLHYRIINRASLRKLFHV